MRNGLYDPDDVTFEDVDVTRTPDMDLTEIDNFVVKLARKNPKHLAREADPLPDKAEKNVVMNGDDGNKSAKKEDAQDVLRNT